MSLHAPSPPANAPHQLALRKAPLFTPYVVVWTMFGVLSLGLLGVLGFAPEWLDDLRPTMSIGDPQSNQGQRAAARLAADINALKDSVSQVQLEVARVSTELANQGQQHKAVSTQLAALEARIGQSQQSTTEARASAAPPAAPAPAPEATTQPAPARTPKVINADAAATAPLETGSLANAKASADAIAFGPAVIKPAPQPLGIKISSGASQDSLRLSWSLLAEKHGDTLKGLEARYTTGGDADNPNYDLIAGPIKSRAEAAKVCKALTAKGVPCSVGAFAGEAL